MSRYTPPRDRIAALPLSLLAGLLVRAEGQEWLVVGETHAGLVLENEDERTQIVTRAAFAKLWDANETVRHLKED